MALHEVHLTSKAREFLFRMLFTIHMADSNPDLVSQNTGDPDLDLDPKTWYLLYAQGFGHGMHDYVCKCSNYCV